MSVWQSYVDVQLIGTKQVNQGAILALDGNTMAASAGLSISPEEGKALGDLFANPADASTNGIAAGGQRYSAVKADERSIYAKQGSSGIVLVNTGRVIVVAVYGEGQQPGGAANAAEKLADHLIENGT